MNIKIPRGEQTWVLYCDTDHVLRFVLTSKESRDYYFLYSVDGEELTKLGKSASPKELEEKHCVEEILRKEYNGKKGKRK